MRAGEPAFPADEGGGDQHGASGAGEIVDHCGVGGVFGEIGLHIEENMEEKAQRGSGIAGEIVIGHLEERGVGKKRTLLLKRRSSYSSSVRLKRR